MKVKSPGVGLGPSQEAAQGEVAACTPGGGPQQNPAAPAPSPQTSAPRRRNEVPREPPARGTLTERPERPGCRHAVTCVATTVPVTVRGCGRRGHRVPPLRRLTGPRGPSERVAVTGADPWGPGCGAACSGGPRRGPSCSRPRGGECRPHSLRPRRSREGGHRRLTAGRVTRPS